MSNWYMEHGPQSDTVVSTRVRLARNLADMNFPSRMTPEMREQLKSKVKDALKNAHSPLVKGLKFIDMADVPQAEAYAMVERHIISPEFAASHTGRAVVLSENESICIMIGEEDHIRIQVLLPGLQLKQAYDTAQQLDSILFSSLHFAFDPELGYLTECPTNLGTGLRASVMLHLPLLEQTGQLSALTDTLAKIGFTVRGLYGEGSKSAASLYQVSNQITLGIGEKTAIDNLNTITLQLSEKEKAADDAVRRIPLEDQIYRALGTLQNCRMMESREALNLLSLIKLGVRMGILDKSIETTEPMIAVQPNMLITRFGVTESEDRDVKRAEYLRDYFRR